MVYVRGHARDFDVWEEMGARGWGYRHVLPYFKRAETSHGGEEGWRGTSGPIHVTRGSLANPLYGAFIEAGRQAGYPVTSDYNGAQQEGFGPMEMTIWQGRRWSTANAYLRPALRRSNVRLTTRAFVRRILLEGKRACGVEYERSGQVRTAKANREVIIAASSINSPRLLQHSGIGDAAYLKSIGIEPLHHLPGVGENLHDHLEVYFQYECLLPVSLYPKLNLLSKGMIGLEWLLWKKGLGATNHFESCAFIRSRAGVDYPDIQYHFLPIAMRYDGKSAAPTHSFQVHVGPMRTKSRGYVRSRSPNLRQAPIIRFNYMSHPDDWKDFRACVHLTREIFRQPAFAKYKGREIQPGDDAISDEQIDAFIRDHAESAYHPCGTCRMGSSDDPLAVVDPQCRVIGIEGLRVADSSIMPRITNGNLNAPTIMIGEKASDHILGREPLLTSNLEPWINTEWRTSQR
jgi:choline dehydrogenase